jgi:hypothetical protein
MKIEELKKIIKDIAEYDYNSTLFFLEHEDDETLKYILNNLHEKEQIVTLGMIEAAAKYCLGELLKKDKKGNKNFTI